MRFLLSPMEVQHFKPQKRTVLVHVEKSKINPTAAIFKVVCCAICLLEDWIGSSISILLEKLCLY